MSNFSCTPPWSIISINAHQYFRIPCSAEGKIYKCSLLTQSEIPMIDLKGHRQSRIKAACWDRAQNKLYVAIELCFAVEIKVIDLKSKTINVLVVRFETRDLQGFMVIGDKLYILGTRTRSKISFMYILDKRTGIEIRRREIKGKNIKLLRIGCVQYLKARQSILLLGEMAGTEAEFFEYCEYSLSAKQWTKWNHHCSVPSLCPIVSTYCTKSGSHIITMSITTEILFLYDTKTKDQQILLMETAPVTMLVDDDKRDNELTVSYINRLYRTSEFKNLQNVPHHLVQMIAKWFSNEYLLVKMKCGKHLQAINLDNILNKMYQTNTKDRFIDANKCPRCDDMQRFVRS